MCQVTARQAAHKHRQPVPAELHAKMPVLARYSGTVKVEGEEEEEESNVWFPATIVRRVEYNKYELQWDDSDDPECFFARCAPTAAPRVAGTSTCMCAHTA